MTYTYNEFLNILGEGERKLVEGIASAYIKVMGADKWESLTEKDKHYVIMTMMKTLSQALDRLDKETA